MTLLAKCETHACHVSGIRNDCRCLIRSSGGFLKSVALKVCCIDPSNWIGNVIRDKKYAEVFSHDSIIHCKLWICGSEFYAMWRNDNSICLSQCSRRYGPSPSTAQKCVLLSLRLFTWVFSFSYGPNLTHISYIINYAYE